MTNFSREESMVPGGEEARIGITDELEWVGIHHPAMLRAGKRAVDIGASLFFFFVFGWLYVVIAIGVLINYGAPGLF